MKNFVQVLLILLFATFHLQLFAGWEIVYRNETSDGHIDYDMLLIDNHAFKYSQNDGGFIYNTKSNQFTWFFNQLKGYWQNDLKKFRAGMFDAMKAVTDEILMDFPEEQREMYAAIFNQMSEVYQDPDQKAIDDLQLVIQKTGNVEEIAGFKSEEYTVKVNGVLVETIWVAPSLDVSRDLDPAKITEVFSELTIDIDEQYHYVYRDEYKNLWKKGFIMRTIDSEGDILEVIKVEQRSITKAEFDIPDGFMPVSAREIITSQIMDSNDDGYND